MTKNINPTRYEVIVQEDPETGELLIPLPSEVMSQLGWKENDQFDFGKDEEDNIIITKRP